MKSRKVIDALVIRLLDQAHAWRVFPTPVEAIVAAQRLSITDGMGNIFATEVLAMAPDAIRLPIQELMAQGRCPLGLLDRQQRVVHIPSDELRVRKRFGFLHEVGHDLCPWQQALVDQQVHGQLDIRATRIFEEEANYAAAQLLFQQDVFHEVAYHTPPSVTMIHELAEQFGASLHATFRHYIERSPACIGGCVIEQLIPGTANEVVHFSIKQTFVATSFRARYALIEQQECLFNGRLRELCREAQEQLVHVSSVEGTLVLSTRRKEIRTIHYHFFSNSYRLFCLLYDDML